MKMPDWVEKWTSRPHGLVGTIADVVGILGALAAVWSLLSSDDIPQSVLAVALGVLTIVSVLVALRLSAMMSILKTKVRAADDRAGLLEKRWSALTKLEKATEHLSRSTVIAARLEEASAERFAENLELACRELSDVMREITGKDCRVTLQEVYAANHGTRQELAVRRIASSSYNGTVGNESTSIDWVAENTDFHTVVENGGHYVCNDLVAALQAGYRNSHWDTGLLATWQHTGDYPYRSTMVFPVSGQSLHPGQDSLRGFLSIDSKAVNVFDEDIVGVIGRLVTLTTYASLVQFRAWREDDE